MNYLISSSMKAIRFGLVEADENAGEFIYDSAAPDTPEHNAAVMRGIADANSIIIPDNLKKRGDIARKLAAELSNLNLPEVKQMTKQEETLEIIKAGLAADKSDDMILVDIINAGNSFRQAGKLFKSIMEDQGLRINNTTRRDQVFSILKKARFKNPKSWEIVEGHINTICGHGPAWHRTLFSAVWIFVPSSCKTRNLDHCNILAPHHFPGHLQFRVTVSPSLCDVCQSHRQERWH